MPVEHRLEAAKAQPHNKLIGEVQIVATVGNEDFKPSDCVSIFCFPKGWRNRAARLDFICHGRVSAFEESPVQLAITRLWFTAKLSRPLHGTSWPKAQIAVASGSYRYRG